MGIERKSKHKRFGIHYGYQDLVLPHDESIKSGISVGHFIYTEIKALLSKISFLQDEKPDLNIFALLPKVLKLKSCFYARRTIIELYLTYHLKFMYKVIQFINHDF